MKGEQKNDDEERWWNWNQNAALKDSHLEKDEQINGGSKHQLLYTIPTLLDWLVLVLITEEGLQSLVEAKEPETT